MENLNLYHIKVDHDQNLKWEEICNELFRDNQCLVVLEKVRENPHFHVQGYSTVSREYFEKLVAKHITQKHWKRTAPGPKRRPVKHAIPSEQREINELGFQYMCKEPWDNVIYQQGFTEGDIMQLREASQKHVEELKNSLKRKLDEVEPTSPESYYVSLQDASFKYYVEADKIIPPNISNRVLTHMVKKDQKYWNFARSKLFK